MSNITIECNCCKKKFIFTEGEQKFYSQKKLVPPKRCKNCREQRKYVYDKYYIPNLPRMTKVRFYDCVYFQVCITPSI